MFRNYLKIALRHMNRNRFYTFINLFGLALAVATCVMIFLFVQDEYSFDTHFPDHENIFRLEYKWSINGNEGHWAATDAAAVPFVEQRYADQIKGVKISPSFMGRVISYNDKEYSEKKTVFADSTFFDIFQLKAIFGDLSTALKGPNNLVFSSSTARKYFGDEDAIGKTVTMYNRVYTVQAIVEDIPKNSHFHFDIYISFDTIRARMPDVDEGGPNNCYSYIKFNPEVDVTAFQQKMLKDMIAETPENERLEEGDYYSPVLKPISSIHLNSHEEKEIEDNSDIKHVNIFITVAIFIIIIACINYMNLATAKSSKRAKEIGIRKTMGSRRSFIFSQFMQESFLLCFMAFILAMILVEIALPGFNQITGKELSINLIKNRLLASSLGVLLFGISFFAGTYPAIFMSGFKPVTILSLPAKAGRSTKFALSFRRIMVITQFAISILLIIGSLTIYKQLKFIRNKKLGFVKEQVVVMPKPQGLENYTVLKEKLTALSGVEVASFTANVPGERVPFLSVRSTIFRDREDLNNMGDDETIAMRVIGADHNYLKVLGLEIIDGRDFDESNVSDEVGAYILNEAAVKAFNLEEPIGIDFAYTYNITEPRSGKVIGVVKDFHYASLHTEVEPVVIHVFPNYQRHLCLKLNSENMSGTMDSVESIWNEVTGNKPFEFHFLDDAYEQLYKAENNMGRIVGYFTVLAIIIACLGLFGLASYLADVRTKEIAIRKILGASIPSILSFLSKEFLLLVCLANLLAWIPSYYILTKWLNGFAYHINIDPMIFLLSGLVAILVAMITILSQALRAATQNPAIALKYE